MPLNTSKIKLDVPYGYTELCRLIDAPILTSNSKTAQTKEWERYFNYTREKSKFVIHSIYEVPLKKTLRKVEDNLSCYSSTLLSYFAYEGGDVFVKEFQVFEICGFIGDEFYPYKKRISLEYMNDSKDKTFPNVSKQEAYNFYRKSSSYLHDCVKGMLKSLRIREIIVWDKTIRCFDTKLNKNRFCTDEEINEIVNGIELDLFNELILNDDHLIKYKVKNKFLISITGNNTKFYKLRNQRAKEYLNISNLEDGYRISFTINSIDNLDDFKIDDKTIRDNKIKTNKFIMKNIKARARKDFDKNCETIEPIIIQKEFNLELFLSGTVNSTANKESYNRTLYNSNFINNFSVLTDSLMSLNE